MKHPPTRDEQWLRVRKIQSVVARYFGVTAGELRGPSHAKSIARARGVAMALVRELEGLSYPCIGRYFGDRNHSTVIAAHRRFHARCESDRGFMARDAARIVELLRDALAFEPLPRRVDPFIAELVRAGVRRPCWAE